MSHSPHDPADAPRDFIRDLVAADVATGKHGGRVVTRFPPEPNGFPHIGHAKSISLNFGLAEEFPDAVCHLRFDDTNPTTEDIAFVEAIQRDVRWLGFDWGDNLFFASDYFERLYLFAEELVRKGHAYVDSQSLEEIREHRGTVTEVGVGSPHRQRSVDENLSLLRRMRAGDFEDGSHVLRAKIDMTHPNMLMRDPILYRIRHAHHYRTGDAWCIYPLYDFAHCLSDAIEGITHSLCTLEFENNRALYDWILDHVDPPARPHQFEFARLNVNYTVMSKRKLKALVEAEVVGGWDDPRMPTLSGYRRRGVRPEAIRDFCRRVGVAKANSTVDVGLLEHCVRDDLNTEARRVLCVLDPLRVVVTNFPEGEAETLEAPFFPRDIDKEGSRSLPFSRVLYIDRDDFRLEPPPGYHRLAPGREVRLRYAYFLRCDEVVRGDNGEVVELRCTYDPETRGGRAPDGRKVKGTIHWVSAEHSAPVEVRVYDRLFSVERPDAASAEETTEAAAGTASNDDDDRAAEALGGGTEVAASPGADVTAEKPAFFRHLNSDSLRVYSNARLEPAVADAAPGSRFQFERHGYFYLEPEATEAEGHPVYNRIVALRDTWAKEQAKARGEAPAPQRRQQPAPSPAAGPQGPQLPEPTTDAQRRRLEHYGDTLGLPKQEAAVLAVDDELAPFFEAALEAPGAPAAGPLAAWIVHELRAALKDRELADLPFGAAEVAALVALLDGDRITGPGAKEVFSEMLESGGDPASIVQSRGLERLGDEGAVETLVDGVLASHPSQLADYRSGKQALFGFFMGQLMKASGGKADPKMARDVLRRKLDG